MRVARTQPIELLLRTSPGDDREPATDEADRRAISQDTLLWEPPDGGLAGPRGRGGQPQASQATDGFDGLGGDPSGASNHGAEPGSQGLSLSAERSEDRASGSGLVVGYHLHSDASRVHVLDGGDRLVQPVRPVLEPLQ